MAHQYSRVGFNSSVEINKVNLSLYYGGVICRGSICHSSSDTVGGKIGSSAPSSQIPMMLYQKTLKDVFVGTFFVFVCSATNVSFHWSLLATRTNMFILLHKSTSQERRNSLY